MSSINDGSPVLEGATDGTLIGNDTDKLRVSASQKGTWVVSTMPNPNGSGVIIADINTTSTNRVVVRRTAYTEQTVNARRSFTSSSALDTALGTGARTLQLTYFDQTGAGPFTEAITLNGVVAVNTVATNICFIESIMVWTAGSGGANAGVISIFAAINAGGGAFGTIAVGDKRTYWGHHYVPTGLTCSITALAASHSSTVVGSGGLFTIERRLTGNVDIQVSDFVRVYGQDSSVIRVYNSPITVLGPARIQVFVAPETATAITYRASFDYVEA